MYYEKHMIDKCEFNLVWWDGVEKVMYKFPQIFCVFVTKRTSKFVARIGNYLALMIQWKMFVPVAAKRMNR